MLICMDLSLGPLQMSKAGKSSRDPGMIRSWERWGKRRAGRAGNSGRGQSHRGSQGWEAGAPRNPEDEGHSHAQAWPCSLVPSNKHYLILKRGFPGGSVVKNLPANADVTGSIPGSERSPGEESGNPLQYSCLGNPNPLQYSCLENPMDRAAWQGLWPMGSQKSQTQFKQLNHNNILRKLSPPFSFWKKRDREKERQRDSTARISQSFNLALPLMSCWHDVHKKTRAI